jgi:hypothetical protein
LNSSLSGGLTNKANPFVITGFVPRETVAVVELRNSVLVPVGQVKMKFGLTGKEPWQRLERLRAGPESRSSLTPVRLELVAEDTRRRAAVGQLSQRYGRRCRTASQPWPALLDKTPGWFPVGQLLSLW